MKNAKRMLALAGMTLAAGAMLGIAPAQAAPAADQSPSTTVVANGPGWNWDDEYVVGVYNNPWDCRRAGGWVGRAGAWGNFDCDDAWDPRWGRVWVLQVEEDDWRWNDWNGWRGDWPYRPHYMHGNRYRIGGAYSHPFRNRHGFRYNHLNNRGFEPWDRVNRFDNSNRFDRFDNSNRFDNPGRFNQQGKIYKLDKRDHAHKVNKIHKSYKSHKSYKNYQTHKSPLGALTIQNQNQSRIPGLDK